MTHLMNKTTATQQLFITIMSNSQSDDEQQLILNYHDACIYVRDLRLLDDCTAWLNDACLHYQFVCLHEQYKHVLFLDPSVVFCLTHQLDDRDEYVQFAVGYPMTCRKVLLPVNDTLADSIQSPPRNGVVQGTHWSLLLILLPYNDSDTSINNQNDECRYIHFDSMMNHANAAAAQAVAQKWNRLWHYTCFPNTTTDLQQQQQQHVLEATTPQQRNGYDCGVHVLLAAQVLAEIIDKNNNDSCCESIADELNERLEKALRDNPRQCTDVRKQMAADIRQRAKAYARTTNDCK